MELYINIIVGFCIFVIGCLFGSFFSLATYRIPRHQDIVVKRSYCPKCNHNLGFFDLIPILSYIIRGGKCKYCKEKISIRYLLLELINGLLFLALYIIFGYTLNLLIVLVLYSLAFVLIGSYVMKTKMTNKEIKNVKMETKKGVFISEIVIAMILFTLLLTSSYVISRNYNKESIKTLARCNAVSIAVKNAETCKATNYDYLQSYDLETDINGIKYLVNVEIIPFSDINSDYENIAKKINVSVKYNVESNDYSYALTNYKGKVNQYE